MEQANPVRGSFNSEMMIFLFEFLPQLLIRSALSISILEELIVEKIRKINEKIHSFRINFQKQKSDLNLFRTRASFHIL